VRDNRYYTVFVDLGGEKIPIIHSKHKHAPIVFLNFVSHIGGSPKTLYSDSGGEFKSQVLKSMFLTKDCYHIKMSDFVVEHMVLLDSMTSYTTNDSSQTIFERVYNVKPSFDLTFDNIRWIFWSKT
jgi:hypothetical protein